jgi:hypothetical protein
VCGSEDASFSRRAIESNVAARYDACAVSLLALRVRVVRVGWARRAGRRLGGGHACDMWYARV